MVSDRSMAARLGSAVISLILVLLGLITLTPIVHLAAMSLSAAPAVAANRVGLWPVNFTLDAYQMILMEGKIAPAFWVSVQRTLLGTLANMAITILTAYPLSFDSSELKGRSAFMWFLLFPMLFSGGLIPTYILLRDLGLLDNFWVMILPGLLPIYNVVMMMNFFRSLPRELREAALMDGAGYLTILVRVVLPVSAASLATISLFCIVGHWNAWFDAMIYISDYGRWPLQTVLRNIINQQENLEKIIASGEFERAIRYSNKTLSSAQIFVATVPILAIYPLLQRYFVTGLTVGSVKG